MEFTWLNLSIAIFLFAGIGFAATPLILARWITPRASGGGILTPYECGMPTRGALVRFGITYYFYALIFIAFDVDVLYLLPVAIRYPETTGWLPFIELTIFIAVLFAAIVYFRVKGVFIWPHKIKTGDG